MDDDLFEAEMADVIPLEEGRARPRGVAKKPVAGRSYDNDAPMPAFAPSDPLPTNPVVILSNIAACIAGKIEALDGKTFNQLSKGEINWVHRLDLHGYFEGDAWLAVMDFVHEAYRNGVRCVVVVTGKGKGYGADGDMGVIKAQIAGWLAHHPRVAAFHTTVPRDGGSGAVYVFLRRNRVI